MTDSSNPLLDSIRSFLVSSFPLATEDIQISDSLLESGIVDSMGVLEIVQFLEAELGVTLEDEDLVGENFETIQNIADFAAAQKSSVRELE